MNRIFFVALAVSLAGNLYFLSQTWQQYIVTSVPDGDSIDIANGMRVRLLGIDAPERDLCKAADARAFLETLAKNHHVVLKDTVTDDYGRTLANVFVGRSLLNRALVEHGLARYTSVKSPYSQELKDAQEKAKSQKLGIWSEDCRQTTAKNLDCAIKGNIRSSVKTYHLPHCPNYSDVIVDTSYGDQWFCSEQEARDESFAKAKGC